MIKVNILTLVIGVVVGFYICRIWFCKPCKDIAMVKPTNFVEQDSVKDATFEANMKQADTNIAILRVKNKQADTNIAMLKGRISNIPITRYETIKQDTAIAKNKLFTEIENRDKVISLDSGINSNEATKIANMVIIDSNQTAKNIDCDSIILNKTRSLDSCQTSLNDAFKKNGVLQNKVKNRNKAIGIISIIGTCLLAILLL